jgi:N6-adenosine-specific RNA methylase IME4
VKDKIVQFAGDVPKIELFARHKTEGWDVWGNEVESDIVL